jgi:hypothetical protein
MIECVKDVNAKPSLKDAELFCLETLTEETPPALLQPFQNYAVL